MKGWYDEEKETTLLVFHQSAARKHGNYFSFWDFLPDWKYGCQLKLFGYAERSTKWQFSSLEDLSYITACIVCFFSATICIHDFLSQHFA